MIQIIQSHKPN